MTGTIIHLWYVSTSSKSRIDGHQDQLKSYVTHIVYRIGNSLSRASKELTSSSDRGFPLLIFVSKLWYLSENKRGGEIIDEFTGVKTETTIVFTVSQMQSDHGHYETLRGQNSVFGKSQHQTLEHFVADRAASLPQQRPEVVAGRFRGVHSFFELLKRYLRTNE